MNESQLSSKIHRTDENSMNERKADLIVEAGTKSGVLTFPAPSSGSEEGQLLIAEAKEHVSEYQEAEVKEGRGEHKNRILKHTGERLARERPRLYRLVAAMLSEQVSKRQIRRTTLCDFYTINSVERREAESIQTLKKRIASTTAKVCKMSIDRIEEELRDMPINQVPVVFGITADKLLTMTGDPSFIVEHRLTANGNIFDRINSLAKTIQAKVIEATVPALTDR
jgi:hypothetical protein